MGTLTVAMFMTLDGFTETPQGDLISPDWSDEMQQYWSGANAHEGQPLLYGRTAFEFNSAYWPTADVDSNPDDYRAFARTMNALPKVVLSNGLGEVGWNATVERGPLAEAVGRIKHSHDGEIVAVGGISIATAWCRRGPSTPARSCSTTTRCVRSATEPPALWSADAVHPAARARRSRARS
ncbi:dihydrofolate reductase family protein [Leifsonia sp. NPDC058292]|uniref:dihydrofolate reductase family protein n=1 Tax=Leifsonia sp. NPDC058292 TaxID=3346428 RepID=UPI0036DB1102